MPVPVIRRLPCRLAVLLLLATWFLLAASSARQTSTTFDEIFHIAGGYSYWTRNDYRIHPTNGNLIQRWIALPLLAGHYQFPSEDSAGWKRPVYHAFEVSQGFLYAPGNEPSEILYRCRLMVMLLSIGLGFVVFLQSRRRFGRLGGLLSLTLLCFCPTILAHGSLATSDLAAALFFLLAVDSIWSLLHRLTFGRLILSLFASAALFLVKFSAPLLLIMTAPMLLVRVASKRAYRICLPGRRTRVRGTATFGLFLALMLIHGIVIWSAIWAAFGFRYRAAGEADPELVFSDSWEFVLKLKSPLAPVMIELCRDNRLLPEAYLFGLAHTLRYSEARAAYLRGECGHTGWSHFFPYAFAVKTPLSLQALTLLMLWALIGAARLPSLRERTAVLFYQAVPLLSLLAVYWYSAVRSNLNLGIRHLLPVFPPLFILLGYLGRRAERQTGLALVIAVLLGWQVVDVVRIYP